jgi:hypothetical protein
VDRLGAVAIGVEQEAAVVVRTVLGSWAGLAVVAVAGVDARLPEGVYVGEGRRRERDVQAARDRVVLVDRGEREVTPPGDDLVLARALEPERREDPLVELLGPRPIRRPDGDVVEQA